MLTLSDISKAFAGRVLFERASLQVNRGDRVGLVGPNGAGKTTLFNIILKEDAPDSGNVLMERGITFGWLPQESAPVGDETVLELATSHESAESRWALEPKAKSLLRGLAFRETDFQRAAKTMSGGWVMRAHLARLLVMEPDLLLLDEPTNHLDLESLNWFREYLKSYPGAILMISHDRDFLNELVTRVVEIAFQKLVVYHGNYDEYLIEREAREVQQIAAHENQMKQIQHLQSFVDRFGAKATKAAQAQSRVKQIEKLKENLVELPQSRGRTVHFTFPQPSRCGQRVMQMKQVDFAYGAMTVYKGLTLEVERGQKTVLVGPNGAGKSTLLKLLAGVVEIQGGERVVGGGVKVGYFSQNRVEMLDPRRSVLEEAMSLANRPAEQLVRNVLGSFLFSGRDAVEKPVAVLSGGEKSRLALAKLLLDPPNFLLMDEPTTHLDIPSIDALIGALKQFEGTIVFVSHDVHFIRNVATTVIHVSAGQLTPYAGDYQYFLDKTRATNAREALVAGEQLANFQPAMAAQPVEKKKIFLSREEKRAANLAREAKLAEKRAAVKRVQALEQTIGQLEQQQQALTDALQNPEAYDKGGNAIHLNRELSAVTEQIAITTLEWEAATKALEQWEQKDETVGE